MNFEQLECPSCGAFAHITKETFGLNIKPPVYYCDVCTFVFDIGEWKKALEVD